MCQSLRLQVFHFSNALTQDTRIKHKTLRPVNYPSFREFIRKEMEERKEERKGRHPKNLVSRISS